MTRRRYSAGIAIRPDAYRQPNRGLAGARNTGARLATGEFIALMDSDDLCLPQRLSVQVDALTAFPNAVLCSSDFSAFDMNGMVSPNFGAVYYSQLGNAPAGLDSLYTGTGTINVPAITEDIDVHHGTVYPEIAYGNFVHPPTVMVRTEALVAAGMFDESIRYNTDWECFVRLARLGEFVHVSRSLLAYRLSDTQMSHGSRGKGALDLVRAFEKISRSDTALAAGNPQRVRNCRREFHADAARALAEHDKWEATRMLKASVSDGDLGTGALTTALKILAPKWLLGWARRLKATRH